MTDFATRRRTMVDTQVRPADVTRFPIIDAMQSVAREDFVPASRRETAYVGEHIPLGDGRVLMEPRLLAKCLDALDLTRDDLVLDVGCSYGYSAAVIAHVAQAVVAVENDPAFVEEAPRLLAEAGADNALFQVAEPARGAPEHGPYDVIFIDGGVETVPDGLVAQLKEGGRMAAIFIDGALGIARIGKRHAGRMIWRDAFDGTVPVLPGFERERSFQL
ncbi:MAG: protein-L-isoaspartate O-methyltransferase family protein [Marinibacterium sp.]